MRRRVLACLGAMLAVALALPAHADEGMWTFDNFPAQTVKQKYGVTIDRAWLDHVRGAAVRLSVGCSASVVSPDGLVLTNHHCVAGCAQNLSTPDRDYVKNGFAAPMRREELQCPGMQADILESISNVTGRVNAATAGTSGADFTAARDAAISTIEKQSCAGKEATHRCQVIPLYQGGQYKLYTYRKYTDVRLVFAVEQQTAFFGGDPDNFNFPRYDLDVSFLRLYENGAPAETPDYLRWNANAPEPGEVVFVAGNPGGTDRLLTVSQLASLRDVEYPPILYQYSELRGRYIRFAEESPEHARIVNRDLFGVENTFKALRGEENALRDPALFQQKRKADAALKARVEADPKLAAEIGNPWTTIDKVQAERAALFPAFYFMEGHAGAGSDLFYYARHLVRAAAERTKANDRRLPEYADARLPVLKRRVLAPRPIEKDVEQVKLEFWLSKLREYLTADSPDTKLVLGQDSPDDLSKALVQSRLGDPAFRKRLWDGGEAAIEASNDPMIRFAVRIDPTARAVRKAWEQKVEGPTDRAAEKIAKARFAVYGASVYPDATFSLRLSYGTIAGWAENGRTVPPFTYFKGLFRRATGQPPYNLAPRWQNAENTLDPDTVFDMVSTNDIIGGNSGSPLIDPEGRVIGAIFDGNIDSLGGNFYFDPATNRSVSVSTAAITEALSKIYDAGWLVKELTGR